MRIKGFNHYKVSQITMMNTWHNVAAEDHHYLGSSDVASCAIVGQVIGIVL